MATTIDPKRLARVRTLALALPGATEKVAWGDPTWRVRDKIFVMQKGNYEGGRPSLWLKVEDGGQSLLVASDPSLFFVPPYVGHKGWVGIYMDLPTLPWNLVGGLIRDSHRLIGPGARSRAEASAKGETSSKGPSPKRTTSKGPSPKRTTSKGASPKRTTSKGPSPKRTTSKGASTKRATSKVASTTVGSPKSSATRKGRTAPNSRASGGARRRG